VLRGDASDFITVCRDEDCSRDVEVDDAAPHADDEWETSEETEGFAGEASGAQAGWDNGEHSHAWRSRGGGGALTD
jgi:hypothetical protein